jgi:hypothetical protein
MEKEVITITLKYPNGSDIEHGVILQWLDLFLLDGKKKDKFPVGFEKTITYERAKVKPKKRKKKV